MKRKIRYRNRGKPKNKIDYIVIVIVIIMLAIGAIFIKLGWDFEENATPVYQYTAKRSNDYEVLLKENTFYETPTLPSKRYYASKSVDLYKMNFQYDFHADKKADLVYHYNIIADLVGRAKTSENENQEVWNRRFVLYESGDNNVSNNEEFSIKEPIDIDYEYYNNLARAYEKMYDIAIDSVLKVHFDIFYHINLSNVGLDEKDFTDSIQLEIPINNTVTQVRENYENVSNENIMPNTQAVMEHKVVDYVIGALFVIGAIMIMIMRICKNKKVYNLNHILNYYSDLIVTVTNEPNISNLKIMYVTKLDDLIDVAEQNQRNIIHYEMVKNEEDDFYVLVDDYVYIYIMINEE